MINEVKPIWYTTLLEKGWVLIPKLLDEVSINTLIDILYKLSNSSRNPSKQVLFTHDDPPFGTPDLTSIMTQWLNPWRWKEHSTINNCQHLRNLLFKENTEQWVLFQEILFKKMPGQGHFHWHQDMPFFPLDKPNGFTCWVALDYCSKTNGSLIIAERSHLLGNQGSVNLYNGKNQDGTDSMFNENFFKLVQPDLEPGDALLFHPLTFHTSEPNLSAKPRRAWATVWFNKGTKWNIKNAPNHPISKHVIDNTIVQDVI